MRAVKWLVAAGVLVAAIFAAHRWFCHSVHASLSYCVEARFTTLPADDEQLAAWLKTQPGVVPHTVHIRRFEPGGRLLEVGFIQVRNLAGEPQCPNLDSQCKA